ncbi:hypothetical protein M3Y94_01179300 [Aphelenchoides besseyi]|nr:hypothetical protein M3Y94_01179300 [Aphelenchoides besseyi]KAI6228226.1 hypothetical protein M3Y95_00600400 [Aphelenchoides besseyi]
MHWIIVLFFLIACATGEFSADFNRWLKEHFGEDVRRHLERLDLGNGGSFGGRRSEDEVLKEQPVIFVHGVSNTAEMMKRSAHEFVKKGHYTWASLYATTYRSGAEGNALQWANYAMECSYVKTVRALIVAVRLYTGRAVDVIGYSLGVPIPEKILVIIILTLSFDMEFTGSPLTKFIDTYVGIAGPNHGIALQVAGIQIPGCVFSIIPGICNTKTGLYSGFCPSESEFLQDINRMMGYEGMNRFSISSRADQLVGYSVCQKITSQIPGEHGNYTYTDKNHDQTFFDSFAIQMSMVRDHRVP